MTDDHDAHVLARIDDAFEHDLEPVPDRLLAAARESFGWRRAEAQLAELLFDSASDGLVGVRGTATDRRSFRFGADGAVIRVHLTEATMIVTIEPPMSTGCRITSAAGDGVTEAHRTDEMGEFIVDVPELPIRVEIDLPSGTTITPWITG